MGDLVLEVEKISVRFATGLDGCREGDEDSGDKDNEV